MPALSWAISALLLASPGTAPWSVEQCVAASEEGQLMQQKGALMAAKAQLELCSHPSCPAIVVAACTGWLDEVHNATPTLIVVARLAGVDQAQARVRLDDQPWLTELSGKPQAVDPGEHRISVELAGQTQQQRLVVNVGEKNRLVIFQLQAPVEAAVAVARPAPGVPLLLSGVTVVGVGLFAGLGLSGRNTLAQLNASPCATTRTCSPSSVAAISRTFVAADVALAVGVVAAVGAAWQWWRWSSVAVTPVVSAQGGGVVLHGRW